MGKNQKVILVIYAAAIVLMCLIPPYEWQVSTRVNGSGYYPLWKPPIRGAISVQFLGIQILVATLVAGALWLTASCPMQASTSLPKQAASKVGVKAKKKVIAAIVCLAAAFAYLVATNALFGWRHGGGAIGMGILSMIVWGIWNAMRGPASDDTASTVPDRAELETENRSAIGASQPATDTAGAKPESAPPLRGTLPPATPIHPTTELSAFELLAAEKAKGHRLEALWLKCHSEANGEQQRAEAAYNKERAQMLMADLMASQEATNAEIRARLAEWRNKVTAAKLQIHAALNSSRALKMAKREHETFVGAEELQNARDGIESALHFFVAETELLKAKVIPSEWENGIPKPQFTSTPDSAGLLPWNECIEIVSDKQTQEKLLNPAKAALGNIDALIAKRKTQAESLRELHSQIHTKAKRKDVLASAAKLSGQCRFADLDYIALDQFNSRENNREMVQICLFLAASLAFVLLAFRFSKSEVQDAPEWLQQRMDNTHTTPSVERQSSNDVHRPTEVGEAKKTQTANWFELMATDKKEAVRLLRKAAEDGSDEAQFLLGSAFAHGEGLERDYTEAVRWFSQSAYQGNAEAQFSLGVLYCEGLGTTKDLVKGINFLHKAAEQEHAKAQFNLGILYGNGIGALKDSSTALKWFKKAASHGHAGAEYNLGLMFEYGIEVPKDEAEAMALFRKAAEHGHDEAQFLLGEAHARGIGVQRSERTAYKWFFLAATQGHREAKEKCKDLETRLPAEFVTEVQRLAREFKVEP
jgi:TPR repeat protein